jgi:hypothetical protein
MPVSSCGLTGWFRLFIDNEESFDDELERRVTAA